jgi:7-cyano-7-deazaguanine synthase
MAKNAVLSLSGGMDSSTLLLHLLREGYNVTALSFDYGQKHRVELKRAQELIEYVNSNCNKVVGQEPETNALIAKLQYTPVNYQVIKIDGITSLLNSALVDGGDEVPEGHYEQDNMKETVVPNRNKIFSSLTQAVALSIANKTQEDTFICLGIHAGDHAIYPDCRQEFRDADMEAFQIGNWDAERVKFLTPYLNTDKFGILEDGEKSCNALDLSFEEVYRRTNTSYKPYPSGNSDYKSASSVERIEAFIKLGRPDPVQYEDESGPVEYEVAKTHVEKLLAEHTN